MKTIPVGYCQCGCGQKTKIAQRSDSRKGWIKGEPFQFVLGHSDKRKKYHVESEPDFFLPNTNAGFCHCGCGLQTKPARTTSRTQGTIKEELLRFVPGHHVVNDERAETETKICTKCKKEKPLKHFYKRKRSKDGYQLQCMACHRLQPSQQHDVVYSRTQILRDRNRHYIWDFYMKHPCIDCGEDDPIVLDFDHVRGKKVERVSKMVHNSRSLEAIQKEIDKCDVVCANCHRRRTAISQGWYRDLLGAI